MGVEFTLRNVLAMKYSKRTSVHHRNLTACARARERPLAAGCYFNIVIVKLSENGDGRDPNLNRVLFSVTFERVSSETARPTGARSRNSAVNLVEPIRNDRKKKEMSRKCHSGLLSLLFIIYKTGSQCRNKG